MINKNIRYWIFLIILGSAKSDILRYEPCTFKYYEGTCQPVRSCKLAMAILRINDYTTLKSMFCGYEGDNPKVCCPRGNAMNFGDSKPSSSRPLTTTAPFQTEQQQNTIRHITTQPPQLKPNILPGRDVCGLVTEDDRIYGGITTKIDEFPWMVRLKYYKPTSNKEYYACTGSLISDRWVLTAAHCLVVLKLVSVRLGEWNTDTEKDCENGVCSDLPVDVKVDKIVVYPGYDKNNVTSGDIALLRLEHPVDFTDFIRPVCLPNTKYIARQDYIDSRYWAAGWGQTEIGDQATVKQKVQLNSVPFSVCRLAIPFLPDTTKPNVICAGGKKGEDTCVGDSGGPLIREVQEEYKINWFLYGITSYGVRLCGSEGKPGIYTRVTYYMDWILDTIAA